MAQKNTGYFGRLSAAIYRQIPRSHLGHWMAGYRREPTALLPGEGRSRAAHMPSERRIRLTAAAERSVLLRAFRWSAQLLADAPARLYGLFFLLYSSACAIIRLVWPWLDHGYELESSDMILCGILVAVAAPIVWTRRSLAGAMSGGKVGHAIFCRLLGIPEERSSRPPRQTAVWVYYLVGTCGMGAAFATLIWHPLVIPAGLLLFGLVCLVLSYPEVGVSLSALMLPFVWIWDVALYALAALILLTWIGYGFQLLLMHRSFRFGRLDALVLLFGGLLLCGGIFSAAPSRSGVEQGLLMAILLSTYFLVVGLTEDRAAVKRCMGGMAAAIVILLILSCVRLIPTDTTIWVEQYRLGSILVGDVRSVAEVLDGLWTRGFEQFFVLALPWLLVSLLSCRRPLSALPVCGMLVLCCWMILRSGSVLAIGVSVLCILLFALLCGHRALTFVVAVLPLMVSAGAWYMYFHPVSELAGWLVDAVRNGAAQCARLWPGVMRMVRDLPGGIGLGERVFRAVYPQYAEPGASLATSSSSLYMDLLARLGVPGLVVALCILVLFCRKCATRMGRCRVRWDRIVLAAGLCTLFGYAVLGTFRSIGSSPQLFFCLVMIMGSCSALASIGLDEQDVLAAEREHTDETSRRVDRFLWTDGSL